MRFLVDGKLWSGAKPPLHFTDLYMNSKLKPACRCSSELGEQGILSTAHKPKLSGYILPGVVVLAVWWLIYHNLATFAGWFTYSVLSLPRGSHLGSAVEFFIYETPKVLMLLTLVVFGVGIIRSFFTPERTRRILSGRRESVGNVPCRPARHRNPVLFLLGGAIVYRLCHDWRSAGSYLLVPGLGADGQRGGSCIALWPVRVEGGRAVFEHRTAHRQHLGVDYRSAQNGEARRGLGIQNADRQRGCGREIELAGTYPVWPGGGERHCGPSLVLCACWASRLAQASTAMCRRTSWPPSWAKALGGLCRWQCSWVCRCIPMPPGSFPLFKLCWAKARHWGTVLAFMMSVIALSLPEAIILRKVLKPRLICVFFGVVAAGIMLVGYLFNLIM